MLGEKAYHTNYLGVEGGLLPLPLSSFFRFSVSLPSSTLLQLNGADPSAAFSQYNGSDPSKPIYARFFDVSAGKSLILLWPRWPLRHVRRQGRSRALAKMSKNDEDVSPSLDGLSETEIGVLNDWEKKFESKYPVVGRVSF